MFVKGAPEHHTLEVRGLNSNEYSDTNDEHHFGIRNYAIIIEMIRTK